jgi:type IV pilus assembly protein PilW
MNASRPAPPRLARLGFTLIELLVAVTIGMGLTLAITLMLIRSEAGRRALTSVNDVSSNGAYLSFTLDRALRSAGSGFAQGWLQSYGCPLNVSRAGTLILPRGAAFPAPFTTIPTTVRLAPLVIHAGAAVDGSDVLFVATGASGLGEAAQRVRAASATSTSLRLASSVGLRAGDLVAIVQSGGTCVLQQLASGFTGGADVQLDFGGTYYASSVNGIALSDLGTTQEAWVTPLGNIAGNRPALQFIGVGANATLFSYDLLRLDGGDDPTPIADGVVTMRARYGVDTNGDGVIDSWVDPGIAPWNAATLLNGSAASQTNLRNIAAVRVGLVLRNATPERTAVSASTLALFSDLAAALRVSYTVPDTTLRYRALEFTVPLRNNLLPRS